MPRDAITLTVDDEALRQVLRQAPDAFTQKVLRLAGRMSLKPIQQEGILRAPRDEGYLEESIKIRSLRGSATMLVGVNYKSKGSRKLTAAGKGAIVEGGTGERTFRRPHTFTTKTGGVVRAEGSGSMPEIPFMEPAIEAKADEALRMYNENLARALLKKMDAVIKKYG